MATSAPAGEIGASGHLSTALAAAVVGFSSSFSVVLTALAAVGATAAQARSGLLALCVVMGLLTIASSWRARTPIGVAWSTPGAAALLGAGHHRFGEAVGGFLVTALLLAVTAAVPPVRRAVAAVPAPLAAGLLAGVLLPLCLAPVESARARPADVLPVLAVWLVVLRLRRPLAVPAAVVAAAVATVVDHRHGATSASLLPGLHLTAPAVTAWSLVAVALPLYLTTMAGQNLPAMALLDGFGYRIPLGRSLAATAVGTAVVAPLGGHAVNLAALTTAMTASPDADPDPARRWRVTALSGAAYVAIGVLSGAVVTGAELAPPGLLRAVAGIALLAALADALTRVAAAPTAALGREAAIVTLLVTASGVTVAGIGSPVIGLGAGLLTAAAGRAGLRRSLRGERRGHGAEGLEGDAGRR